MAPNSGDLPPHVQRLLATVAGEKGGSLVGGLGGARVMITSRKNKGETGALLASAKKAGQEARDVLLAAAPLVQLPSSLYCSLLAYPSPFHWHLRAMVATYLTLQGIASCLQLPLGQMLDCTKVLGAVGWERKEHEGPLMLEGETEGGSSYSTEGGEEEERGRREEKFLFIDLTKGELRLM